ncbi:Osiris [Anopheles darlingi]|uniref:Osiris n=1 Tax=Anopheles darlingi TaxID=43151 RepID=W5JJJ1_ANODA|nr:Osiris [Anopheles darlingi]
MAPKRCVLIVALVVVACAWPGLADSSKDETNVIQLIDEIDGEERFPLFGGLTVERSSDYDVRAFGGRSSEDLAERAVRYLSSHTLKFNVPSEENTVEGEKVYEICEN